LLFATHHAAATGIRGVSDFCHALVIGLPETLAFKHDDVHSAMPAPDLRNERFCQTFAGTALGPKITIGIQTLCFGNFFIPFSPLLQRSASFTAQYRQLKCRLVEQKIAAWGCTAWQSMRLGRRDNGDYCFLQAVIVTPQIPKT